MNRILRILSGLHQGAQMELAAGDWLIGSDALCDILLNDVAPKQALLRIGDDGSVFLLPVANADNTAQNYLQGEHVPEQGIAVPLYTCISFGEVHAALGEIENTNWPSIDMPQNTVQAQVNSEDIQNESTTENVHRETVPHTTNLHMESNKAPAQSTRMLLRLVVIILLLSLCLGGIWTFSGPPESELQHQDINAVLRSHNASGLTVQQDEQGIWHIYGGVSNDETQKKLEQSLQGLPFKVQAHLVSFHEIQQSLEERIKAEGALLRVRTLQNGLRVSGYVYDANVLENLLAPLQSDLTYVYLQKDIAFYAQIQNSLQESLATLGLQDMIKLSPGPYGIVLETSALSREKKSQLQAFIQEAPDMARGINPFIKAKTKTISAPKNSSSPVPSIKIVEETNFCDSLRIGGMGEQLYVVYLNKNYPRGAHLPNGLQVQEIREKYSTFTQGDRLLYCPR